MIKKGLLLPDSQPVGIGINGARRGAAELGSDQVPVIYKSVPPAELAAELFCAALARKLSLPAPEPLLLFDPVKGEYVFGSIDLQYPNALRSFNVDPDAPDEAAVEVLLQAVVAWGRAKEVAAFDEWIHNCDRNLGNLLFASTDHFYIIDHGRSLNIDPTLDDANVLCDILSESCQDARATRALLKSLYNVAAQFDLLDAEISRADVESTGVPSHVTFAAEFYDFVEERLSMLTTLLQNRMPGQHGLMLVPPSK